MVEVHTFTHHNTQWMPMVQTDWAAKHEELPPDILGFNFFFHFPKRIVAALRDLNRSQKNLTSDIPLYGKESESGV